MKKSSGHLTFGLLLMAVLVALTFMVGRNLPKEANASTDLTDGYKLVYDVDSSDSETVKKAADVLEKRLYAFGADSVTTSVEGSQITLIYNGIEDNDNLRKNLTRTGELSLRNSKDEKLASEGVLADENPLACGKAENGTTVYFRVGSVDALKALHAAMVAANDTMLVVWVDYQADQKYETEAAKDNPAFLIGARMSSALDGDFYVTTNKNYEETLNDVRVVNGGVLPAAISEKAFESVEATYGKGALNRVFAGLFASLALIGLYLIYKYRLTGLVNTVSLFAFTVASLISISWLDVSFKLETVALVLTALFAGLFVTIHYNDKFGSELQTGRNARTSYTTVSRQMAATVLAGAAFMLISGLAAYLFVGELRSYGIIVMVLAVCLVLFVLVGNMVMMNHLISSNYFEKSAYFLDKQLLKIKDSNFKAGAYIMIGCCGVGLLVHLLSNNADIALVGKNACCMAAGILAAVIFNALTKRNYNNLPVLCGALTAFMGGYLCMINRFKDAQYNGLALLTGALSFIYAMVVLRELNDGYKEISRGKLSEEKVQEMYNGVVTRLNRDYCICLIALIIAGAAVYLLGINYLSGLSLIVVATAVSCGAGCFVTAALWLKNFIDRRNKPAGKKKAARKSNELKEATVFGINEIR